jgi:hypothetical protein
VSKTEKALYDRLAKSLRGMGPERLAQVLGKTESLRIRVTPTEKDGMRRVASLYGLTITEYVSRLHALVQEITETKKKTARREPR